MIKSCAVLRYVGSGLVTALAMLGAIPAYAASCSLSETTLPVTMIDWRASVPITVNGKKTSFWLDSGAFFNIMSAARAAELDLPLQNAPDGMMFMGIGGSASMRVATIRSLGIIGAEVKNVQFIVGGSDSGNGMIGRNFLAFADTEFDLANGSVKLVTPRGCDSAIMAYWAGTNPYFVVPLDKGPNPRDHLFRLPVSINGARILADIDTGAPQSLLSRRAAQHAGIDLSAPDVVATSGIGGFGSHVKKGWIVPVQTVAIGDEQILKTHLTVIDGNIIDDEDGPDMLLGADFVMAHHIYVARGQGRIYFTYSGGKAFLTEAGAAPVAAAPAVPIPAGTVRVNALAAATEPKNAEEFARRGNARLHQRNFDGAIDDLTKAIGQSPNTAAYFRDRSKAYAGSSHFDLARADLAKALELDPNDAGLLRQRALLRLSENDRTGALADAEAAARLTPPTSLDVEEVAFLFERLHQPQRAISVYDGVIAVHREDSQLGELLNGRCWVRALANVELDKALGDCNRAIKRDGPHAAYLDSRGLVNFRRGNLTAAVADYDAALKQNARLAWSLYMRGLAKIAQGQTDAGKADQLAAAAIEPGVAETAAIYGIGH